MVNLTIDRQQQQTVLQQRKESINSVMLPETWQGKNKPWVKTSNSEARNKEK